MKSNILQWCRHDKTRQRRIRQDKSHLTYLLLPPSKLPNIPPQSDSSPGGRRFSPLFAQHHFLPAAWSGSAEQNILQSTKKPSSTATSFPFTAGLFCCSVLPVRLFATSHRRIPGPRHPRLAIHRRVINQAITLIFRHRSIREQGAITIARSTTEGLPFDRETRLTPRRSPVPGLPFRYKCRIGPHGLRRSFYRFLIFGVKARKAC